MTLFNMLQIEEADWYETLFIELSILDAGCGAGFLH